jgi:alpha-tubulin suppressor-like RCC1 family protein
MTLAAVLNNNEIELHGYNKDGDHYKGTSDPECDSWEKVKLEPALSSDDTIIDLASGTHFTLLVTKKGYLYGTGKKFLSIIGMENTGSFQRLKVDPEVEVKRVWASRGKETYLALIEVHNKITDQTYLMSAGTSTDGLLGQGSDDITKLTTFTKLNYDNTKLSFKKISLLTRHALAISTDGDLYGWGSNDLYRLGQPADVKSLNKPTPIDFFNDRTKISKVLDIASGDDHSFVYIQELDKFGFNYDVVMQIGYNKDDADDKACMHRGTTKETLDKDAPEANGIVPYYALQCHEVKCMAAGHKTSLFYTGNVRIVSGKNGKEIDF